MKKGKWEQYERRNVIPQREREFVIYMLDMVEEDALRFRLSNLILWYIDKAIYYKHVYYALSITAMAANLLILIANAAGGVIEAMAIPYDTQLVTTVLAAIASCALGINNLGRNKDNWMRYRKSAEVLKESLSQYVIKMKECQARNAGKETACGCRCETGTYGEYQCPLIKGLMEQVSEYVTKENEEWKKAMGQEGDKESKSPV